MPLKDVEDMTWAEFRLRSFGYWEERKFQMQMTREVSYEVFGLNWMLSKQKPPSKERYWPIGKNKKIGISDRAKEELLRQKELYRKKKRNG